MKKLKSKNPRESAVEMREIVMPHHSNSLNTIFGGQVMAWIDVAAAMAASRHAESVVVTVHVDNISFKEPAKIGDHLLILATVNFVGNTSMEVGTKVICENPITGESKITTTAHLTFVALDEKGKPTKVHRLVPETDEEKKRYENAKIRCEYRKKMKEKMEL